MKLFRRLALAVVGAAACLGAAEAQTPQVLKVATDATFMPFEYFADGKMTGFDIELVEAMAAKMGKKVEWTNIDFKGLIPGLQAKRFDMAVSAIYITEERRKVVDFSAPYYPGGLVILVKSDNAGIKGPDDLAGKKVSVQVGTKSVGYLQQNYPKVERVEVEKNQEMFNLVQIGRVDAAVTGKPAAKLFAKSQTNVKVLDKQLTVEEYGMAVRKDLAGLTQEVDAALAKLKADGTYAKLVAKWFESGN